MARMVPAKSLVTHCPANHPLSGDNLYIHPRGGRRCRACSARWVAEQRQGKSEAPCTAEGCDRNAYVRAGTDTAVCELHYQRERRDAKRLRKAS